MNSTLLKKEIKSNYKIIILFLLLISMYCSIIVFMFDPSLGNVLNVMKDTMPELFAAFGMNDTGTTLIEFIANYLYGFILIAIPLVGLLILANRLVVRYVERGSLAYLLATPHTRKQMIVTQIIMMVLSTILMVVFATVLIILVSAIAFPDELAVKPLIMINVGLLGLLLFMGSVCFLASCLFNDARMANGIGGGFIMVSVLLQMIGQVGDKFVFLKYLTPITLFDVSGIIAGTNEAYVAFGILYIVGILVYVIATNIFCNKDLPI